MAPKGIVIHATSPARRSRWMSRAGHRQCLVPEAAHRNVPEASSAVRLTIGRTRSASCDTTMTAPPADAMDSTRCPTRSTASLSSAVCGSSRSRRSGLRIISLANSALRCMPCEQASARRSPASTRPTAERASPARVLGMPAIRAANSQVLAKCQLGIQPRNVADEPDPRPRVKPICTVEIGPENLAGACRRAHERGDDPQQGGLSRPIGAEQPDGLARLHDEVDVAKNRGRSNPRANATQLNKGRLRRHPRSLKSQWYPRLTDSVRVLPPQGEVPSKARREGRAMWPGRQGGNPSNGGVPPVATMPSPVAAG